MLDEIAQCGNVSLEDPLAAIKDGDAEGLGRLLPVLREPAVRTRLLAAALTEGKADSRTNLVRVILDHGADPNMWDSALHKAPLHLAMERGLNDAVQILLDNKARPDARTSSSETGLHCTIRGLKEGYFSDETQAITCMETLLKATDSIIDARDDVGGFTAIHLASKFKHWKIVKFLIQHKAHIDIPISGISARKIIRDTSCDELAQLVNTALIRTEPNPDYISLLQNSLKKSDDTEFIELVKGNLEHFKNVKDESYGKCTFLQTAAKKGFLQATKELLDAGADVNLTSMEETQTPAMLATTNEHSEVLNELLKTGKCNLAAYNNEYHKMTALHIAVTANKTADCLDLLLQNSKACQLDIDAQDFREYTALHYASKMSKNDMVSLLLKYNANIFIKDYENIPAFFEIDRKIINDMLDEGITTENNFTSEEYTLVFNYNFFATAGKCKNDSNITTNTTSDVKIPVQQNDNIIEPEMTPLEMFANSPEHRSLLTHPLIRSFLHLKWYRIYWFFYINFIFYLLFTASLSLHVYYLVTSNCTNISTDETESVNSVTCLRVITAIFLVGLTIREIVQAIISPWRYINILENWIEMILIVLTTIIIIEPSNRPILQSIAAFAILLTFTEFVLLAGRHPSLSTYIKMFFRVLTSFVQLLLWYSILIIGFGFAFYIVFRNCETQNFFIDLYTSLFKTFIMLTGEFESGDLSFNTLAVTSHIIFILFLFFIAIVLLNLLNGLAVSDTQAIRNEAEIHCCVAQVRLYSELESALLGGTTLKHTPMKEWLGKYILMLSRLNKNEKEGYALRVLLKKDNRMEPDIRGCARDCTDIPHNCFMRCTCLRKACRWCLVFNTIVSDAKQLAEQKGKLNESQQVLNKIEKLEKAICSIAKTVGAEI